MSAWLLAPVAGFAAQFVLFDVTFTFTKEDADNSKPSQSHYYVKGAALNPERPRDWTAPIDYRHGTVHLRTEVLEKPAGGEPTTWNICYIPNRGQGNGYGCTGTDLYREKGVYEKDVAMTAFWQNDAIVWTDGIKQMDLVMKDGSGGAAMFTSVPTRRDSSPPSSASPRCRSPRARLMTRAWFRIFRPGPGPAAAGRELGDGCGVSLRMERIPRRPRFGIRLKAD